MKIRIKRISPLSLALTLGGIYFVIGCLIGLFVILGTVVGAKVTLSSPLSGPLSIDVSGLGILPLSLLYPFALSIGGGILGYLIAWIYNFIARYTRGLVIETEEAGRYDSLF